MSGHTVAVKGDDSIGGIERIADMALDRGRWPIVLRPVLQLAVPSGDMHNTPDARIVKHSAGTEPERSAGQLHFALTQAADALVVAVAQHKYANSSPPARKAEDRGCEEQSLIVRMRHDEQYRGRAGQGRTETSGSVEMTCSDAEQYDSQTQACDPASRSTRWAAGDRCAHRRGRRRRHRRPSARSHVARTSELESNTRGADADGLIEREALVAGDGMTIQ